MIDESATIEEHYATYISNFEEWADSEMSKEAKRSYLFGVKFADGRVAKITVEEFTKFAEKVAEKRM